MLRARPSAIHRVTQWHAVWLCLAAMAVLSPPLAAAPASSNYPHLYSVPGTDIPSVAMGEFSSEQREAMFTYIRSLFLQQIDQPDGNPLPDLRTLPAMAVHLSLRHRGAYLAEGVAVGHQSLSQNLRMAIFRAIALRRQVVADGNRTDFTANINDGLGIELTLFLKAEALQQRSISSLEDKVDLGLDGLALIGQGRVALFAPSKPIIHNYSTRKLMERLGEALGADAGAYRNANMALFKLTNLHLVQASAEDEPSGKFRSDRPVSLDQVTATRVDGFLHEATDWLRQRVRNTGRMQYKYMPSRGEYSRRNNMIRQWMATLALASYAREHNDARTYTAWQRNANYNLVQYYRERDGLGFIYHDNKAKLGAAALAALALQEGGADNVDEHVLQRSRLIDLLWHLRQPDGSFRTFLIPQERNDLQSFYSGEAMLALSRQPSLAAHPEQLAMLRASMIYYMQYYQRTNRYTPFVPWHTMAYWELFRLTDDEAYRQAIFEMNDWLICIQDLSTDSAPDIRGRFFRQEFSGNGPPHASSTAVYVEGLAYAYDLAVRANDEIRAQAYLTAIRWGLRSLMQLQYRTDNNFYLSRKARAMGGLRTTVTDNQLRIDNTQHAIMAAMAVRRFVPADALLNAAPSNRAFVDRALQRFSTHQRPAAARNGSPRQGTGTPAQGASLLLGGDVQLGRFTQRWADRYGKKHAFRGIQPYLDNADGLFVNLECVVADSGQAIDKSGEKVWHLRARPDMLEVFPSNLLTVVSTANNHAMDYGPDALMEMLDTHLPAQDILFSGAGRNSAQAVAPVAFTLNGIQLQLFSFTTIEPEFAATDRQPGYAWISERDLNAFNQRLQQALHAHANTEALQLLSLHWGANHTSEASPMQQQMAKAAIDMGFDAVIGHHSHRTHGIEIYRNKPIFYDLGNFLVDFKFQGWDDLAVMPRLTLNATGIQRVELIPITLRDKAVNVAVGEQADAILEQVARLSHRYATAIQRDDTGAWIELAPAPR